MDIFQKINSMPILEVLEAFWIQYKKVWWNIQIIRPDGSVDESFSVSEKLNIANDFWKSWVKWWPFDIIGRYILNTDTQTPEWRTETLKLFKSKFPLEEYDNKPEEKQKVLSNQVIYEKFITWEFDCWWYNNAMPRFLTPRWFTYEWINKNANDVGKVFKHIWYYDNYFTTEFKTVKNPHTWDFQNLEWDDPKTVDVFLFPCYDHKKNIIWMKIRRVDWKQIRWTKSSCPYWTKTWLIYDNIDISKPVYITEWEMDYIVLKLLWYKNVVWNLWWVQSNAQMIKDLCFKCPTIICLYDEGTAWDLGKKKLQELMNREVLEMIFPVLRDKQWNEISDINDLYKAWYDTKTRWDELLKEVKPINSDENINSEYPFIFIRQDLMYYDTEYNKFQDKSRVSDFLNVSVKDLTKLMHSKEIKQYEWLCYYAWWKKWYYNLLDETTIIKDWWEVEPVLHPHIKKLIDNICSYDENNTQWVHRSILYKLTHLNDVSIPALLLYGQGWSWKGLFFRLLSKIFWEENSQFGLNMDWLKSWYDSYKWEKLIVEFWEISSWNTHDDKKITDKIKTIVWQDVIEINPKFEPRRRVDNIARFHFSSNHSTPIQLDSKHSGNRRFTIIKSWPPLDPELWAELYTKTLKDRYIIRQYVNRLYKTYPEIPELSTLQALDNEAKRNLEEACEWAWNQFFEWFERNFPYIWKMSIKQKNKLLKRYCKDTWESEFDDKFKQKNFDTWLSHRYEKKFINIWGISARWYFIHKTPFDKERIPTEEKWYWEDEELNKLTFK